MNKKKTTSAKKTSTRAPVLALSQVEEKELVLDTHTLEKLESYLEANGGSDSGLSISDIVTHLLLSKGQKGFKFQFSRNESKTIKLTLPKSAWNIAEVSAKSSGIEGDLSEVVKKLAAEL